MGGHPKNGMSYNVRSYAMFGGGIMWPIGLTAAKYGSRSADFRNLKFKKEARRAA